MAIGKKIKGITIEFNGDTTKLGKALKDVESKSKSLDSELRQINKALRFNPGNTELLAQKQKVLAERVNQTKDKLTQLKAAQSKLDDDPAVDKTSQEYRELRREIITTESKLKSLENESRKLSNVKMTALGERMKQIGSKAKNVGDSMTRYVTAPLLGVGAAAVKVGLDFDEEMSKVSAISGTTGKDFDTLRKKAREMGSSTKFTATEAGQGFEYMAMAGWKTKDMLDGIEPILKLAAASGEDLGTTSDIVTDALTAFGLKASDTAHFADVLAQASSNANTNVGMMGETFKYAAPVAGALGYSIEDVGLAIGLMANSGIKASNAGTALRSIMSRMASPTDAIQAAMDKLGLSLTNSDGSMKSFREIMIQARTAMQGMTEAEKTQIATDLAGKNAMSGFLAIVNASDEDFNKLATSIDNCNGATDRMEEAMMNNAKGGITVMISALQNAAIAISDVLSPYITKLAGLIEGLANKFSELSPTAQGVILAIAAIVAAIGPLLSVGGRLIIGIGMLTTMAPGFIAGFTALLGPIGLVVAAIAALVAIGVALYKNWDKIKKFAGTVKKVVVDKFTQMKNNIKETFTAIKDAMIKPIEKAKEIISGIIQKIKDFFNFKVSLPHIKLPHFAIDPPGWKISDLLEGVIPTLGIDWYAKGGIFNRPTVAGLGDVRGGEAALPLEPFWKRMDKIIEAVENGSGEQNTTFYIYGENKSAKQIAAEVERVLVRQQKQKQGAFA